MTVFNENSKVRVVFYLEGCEDSAVFNVEDLVDLEDLAELTQEEQIEKIKSAALRSAEDVAYEYVSSNYQIEGDTVKLQVSLNKYMHIEKEEERALENFQYGDEDDSEINEDSIEEELDAFVWDSVELSVAIL